MTFAFSGDPDDAFAFYGLACGAIKPPGGRKPLFVSDHIQTLNEAAIEGRYEVSAVSAAVYPLISRRYFISSVGSSVGRCYGPMLASRRFGSIDDLRGRKVASPGPLTTGNLLLWWACPECERVYLPFDRIREAILRDEVDAGVLIHEELLNYEAAGLRKVRCLGEAWSEKIGLPLPVGLNVIRRDLGRSAATATVEALRQSLLYALAFPREATAYASDYSIAVRAEYMSDFIGKFANDDTLDMNADIRRALDLLLEVACELHGAEPIGSPDIL